MARSSRASGAANVLLCVLFGCSSLGVRATRSDEHAVPTDPTSAPTTDPSTTDPSTTDPNTTDPSTTDPSTTDPSTTDPGDSESPHVDPVAWTACDDEPSPWQCGAVTVPMDYERPEGRQLSIALTRLPASEPSARIGSLILNPGGPGGSGLTLAYDEAEQFPAELRQRFDIVGFDPRGVGSSTAVECPPDFDIDFDDFDPCIELTGELVSYLGTPNVVRDLDMIRRAVGDEALSYVGYSYGTAVGGLYGDMFPEHVRALVLDGAVDPEAGSLDESGDSEHDYYVEQDFEGTIEVYHELCNASTLCESGPHSAELLERVESSIRDLPTDHFDAGGSGSLGRFDVDDLVLTAMYSTSLWPLLAIALKEADEGDASTLAALYSWVQFGYPADMEAAPNFDFAHLAIQCADFAGRDSSSYGCDAFPDTAEALPEIVGTDAARPILVIGTADDPATPARYATQMADALNDAVAIEWEGAGHTAFLTSLCVNDIVTRYLIDLVVPPDGEQCPFVVGASTITERADVIFADADPVDAATEIRDVLLADGQSDQAATCIAAQIVRRGDQRIIAHAVLGVDAPDLLGLRAIVDRGCGVTD